MKVSKRKSNDAHFFNFYCAFLIEKGTNLITMHQKQHKQKRELAKKQEMDEVYRM